MNGIAGKPSHDDRLRVILSPDRAGEIAVGTEYIVNVARLFLQQKQSYHSEFQKVYYGLTGSFNIEKFTLYNTYPSIWTHILFSLQISLILSISST